MFFFKQIKKKWEIDSFATNWIERTWKKVFQKALSNYNAAPLLQHNGFANVQYFVCYKICVYVKNKNSALLQARILENRTTRDWVITYVIYF